MVTALQKAARQALEALADTVRWRTTGLGRPPEQTAMDAITDLQRVLEQPAQPEQEPVAWCPDVCPITGLPFFMWIEHHETGQNVPTYGGPYDSYTIPVRDKDGSYCRERYDHDLGGWLTDEVEDVGVQIVSDQAYVSDDEPTASKPLTDDEFISMVDSAGIVIDPSLAFEIKEVVEAAHGIKGGA